MRRLSADTVAPNGIVANKAALITPGPTRTTFPAIKLVPKATQAAVLLKAPPIGNAHVITARRQVVVYQAIMLLKEKVDRDDRLLEVLEDKTTPPHHAVSELRAPVAIASAKTEIPLLLEPFGMVMLLLLHRVRHAYDIFPVQALVVVRDGNPLKAGIILVSNN